MKVSKKSMIGFALIMFIGSMSASTKVHFNIYENKKDSIIFRLREKNFQKLMLLESKVKYEGKNIN